MAAANAREQRFADIHGLARQRQPVVARPVDDPLDFRKEHRRRDRLRYISVGAGGEASFAIPLERVRRERHDRECVPPVACSRTRIAAIASAPPISGICMSMRIRSNGSRSNLSSAMQSVFRERHRVPGLLEHADRDALVDDVVLGQQNPERRAHVSCATGATATGFEAVRPSVSRMAWHRAICRTGLTRYDAMPSSRQRAESCGSPDEVSIMIVGAGVLASSVRSSRHGEAVHAGHVRVEQHQLERFAPRARPRATAMSAAAPLSTSVGRIFHFSSIFSKMRRFVALSSTTSTRHALRAPRCGASISSISSGSTLT